MFAARVRDLLRKKATISRILRETSATAQVMAAAGAASLAAVTGGATKAVTILAGSAAVIPTLQSVFEAKERAEAYNQGVGLVADAESRYLTATHGRIETTTLTQDGAHLIEETIAALKLVETAIISQIPDTGDVQKARGIRAQGVPLTQDAVQFASSLPSDQSDVLSTDGSAITGVGSDNNAVASASFAGNKVTVNSEGAGVTRIKIIGQSGKVTDLPVQVLLDITDSTASGQIQNTGAGWKFAMGGILNLSWSNNNGDKVHIEQTPDARLKVIEAADGKSATLTATSPGKTTMIVRTARGARRTYDIEVVP